MTNIEISEADCAAVKAIRDDASTVIRSEADITLHLQVAFARHRIAATAQLRTDNAALTQSLAESFEREKFEREGRAEAEAELARLNEMIDGFTNIGKFICDKLRNRGNYHEQ